jgi:hypothetical protein
MNFTMVWQRTLFTRLLLKKQVFFKTGGSDQTPPVASRRAVDLSVVIFSRDLYRPLAALRVEINCARQ